ncbi:MAG: methyltransferase domain-containing protein [Prolixibacteraceae bacterium]
MYQLNDLRSYLENACVGHLLDVATGEGDFLRFLLESVASFDSATGLEPNKESLAQAKNKLFPYKVDLVLGNVRKLPFEESYFDFVTVSNGLHHFEHPVKAIQAMMRVLVSGGRLLINETICDTLNPAQEAHHEFHTLKADIDTAKGGYHRHNYNRAELFALLQEAHVEAEKIFISDNEPPMLNSKEKVWQFTHKIDEMVELAGELPQKNSYESRSWALKEKIKSHGFQKPPQLALIAYKP